MRRLEIQPVSTGGSLRRDAVLRPWISRLALFCSPPILLIGLSPVAAQGYGQWWWVAEVGVEQRNSDSLIDGQSVGSHEQTDMRLSTALHGYVLHPAVGNFRVGVEALVADRDNASDTDNLGFDAGLGLLPRGAYPFHLFAKRTLYDYSVSNTTDPFASLRAPEVSTTWGSDLAVRRGAIQGLSVGFNRTTSEFRESAGDSSQRETLRWSRNFGDFQHDLRVEHFAREFGSVDTGVDDLIASLNQRAVLSPTWRWSLVGTGTRREVSGGNQPDVANETAQLRTELVHEIRDRDELALDASFGVLSPEASPNVESQGLSVFYRWRPAEAWELGPFVQYTRRSSDSISLQSPRVGVTTSWLRQAGVLQTHVVAGAGYGTVDQEDSDGSMEQSDSSYSLSGTVSHGERTQLRKELELSIGRNDLRLTREPVFELPDLGLADAGLGSDDYQRVRLTLGSQREAQHMDGWVEWSKHESDGSLFASSDREAFTGTVQYGNHVYGVTGNLGRVEATGSSGSLQQVRFASAQGFWRPRPYLALRGAYRANFRNVDLSSDVDADRLEAGITLRAGLFEAEITYFESQEELDGGETQTKRGFNWSFKRRFRGGLPIVTGTERRGTIR